MAMPEQFLEARVHDLEVAPSLSGLCVGYELGEWRASQFSRHIFEWLPEFALNSHEYETISGGNSVARIRKAANVVYQSEKFKNRGEFGELFLHAAIRQIFDSLPAISKIFYKSSTNETVKGFDAVHVVGPPDKLELWLGEAKFYSDIGAAIRNVVVELNAHVERDYLRNEFVLIAGKIDPRWGHYEALSKLLSSGTSLDSVFRRVCMPVLLTYDSECVNSHDCCSAEYCKNFLHEIRKHHSSFAGKGLPENIRVHLFLLPLKSKDALITELDQRLRTWQCL